MSGNAASLTKRIVDVEQRLKVVEQWGNQWQVDLIEALLFKWEDDVVELNRQAANSITDAGRWEVKGMVMIKQNDIDELRGILGKEKK